MPNINDSKRNDYLDNTFSRAIMWVLVTTTGKKFWSQSDEVQNSRVTKSSYAKWPHTSIY